MTDAAPKPVRTAFAEFAPVIRAGKSHPEWKATWEAFFANYRPLIDEIAAHMQVDRLELLSEVSDHLYAVLPRAKWDETRRFAPYLCTVVMKIAWELVGTRVRGRRGEARPVGGSDHKQVLDNHPAPAGGPSSSSSVTPPVLANYGELVTASLAWIWRDLVSRHEFTLDHADRLAAIEGDNRQSGQGG